MASNLTVDSISKGSTTVNTDEIVDTSSNQICKAWVNFNGQGTVAIRDSFNVSSITDQGTSNYDVNFSTSMPNANYSVSGSVSGQNYSAFNARSLTTSNFRAVHNPDYNHSFTDGDIICASVFSN